jgi:hypothetical protein
MFFFRDPEKSYPGFEHKTMAFRQKGGFYIPVPVAFNRGRQCFGSGSTLDPHSGTGFAFGMQIRIDEVKKSAEIERKN